MSEDPNLLMSDGFKAISQEIIGTSCHLEVSWNRGTPSHHPFIDGFSLINYPAMGVPLFMETSGYIWYINGVQFSILPGDAGANLLLTHSGDASSTENWALALWRIWALSMGILLYWNCHCGTMPLEFPSPVHFGAPFREYVFFFPRNILSGVISHYTVIRWVMVMLVIKPYYCII